VCCIIYAEINNKPDSAFTWVLIGVFLPHRGVPGYRRVSVFLAVQAVIYPTPFPFDYAGSRRALGPRPENQDGKGRNREAWVEFGIRSPHGLEILIYATVIEEKNSRGCSKGPRWLVRTAQVKR
jgi:hypothetical protein